MDKKYPLICVDLTNSDGNSMMIVGKVRLAMRRAYVPIPDIERFTGEALSGDYDNVLQTCMRWVNIS